MECEPRVHFLWGCIFYLTPAFIWNHWGFNMFVYVSVEGLLNVNELDPIRRHLPAAERPRPNSRYSSFQVINTWCVSIHKDVCVSRNILQLYGSSYIVVVVENLSLSYYGYFRIGRLWSKFMLVWVKQISSILITRYICCSLCRVIK